MVEVSSASGRVCVRGVPPVAFPLEFINGGLAALIVLAWANAGLVVAAPLVMILAVTIPLSRTTSDALAEQRDTGMLDAASAETRAIISAFHPATVRISTRRDGGTRSRVVLPETRMAPG
jgi:hypothetical protein